MSASKYWSESDKAFWILQNGAPKIAWIFERNGDMVYRRPMAEPGTALPPWINTERELISSMLTGTKVDKVIIDEEYTKNVY